MASLAKVADGAAGNPFCLPPEMECFWLHEPDLERSEVERALERKLKVWQKSTASSKCSAVRKLRDEDIPMAPLPAGLQKTLETAKGKVTEAEQPDDTFLTSIATKPSIGLVEPLAEKGSGLGVRSYVQKKRDVFLAHMACEVKKEEIARLEEKARLKEAALADSQRMLDEDAKRFEEFLQEKIARAQQATREAEAHAKRRAEKQQRIKQLRLQIATLQSEVSKLREERDECVRYKKFLDKLTPHEWKDQQAAIKRQRKAERRRRWIEEKAAPVVEKLLEEERLQERREAEEQEAEARLRRRVRGGAKRDEDQEAQRERERQTRRRRLQRRREDEEKRWAAEYQEVSSEEEFEFYFKDTAQLMESFTELEEKNLSLIQRSQDTEQALDERQQSFEQIQREMGSKVQQLKESIRQVEQSITQEQQQCAELRQRYAEKASTEAQDKKLAELAAKVHDVYVRCGLSKDHSPDTLQMLAQIESKIEELIQGVDEAYQEDSELVMQLEWQREKERRERVRVHRIKEQMDKQEERLRNSLLRSQAPVFRKAGKQVMYRSPPLRQEKRVVQDTSIDEAHAREHKVFSIYIDRRTQLPETEPPVLEDTRRPHRSPVPGSQSPASAPDAALGAVGLEGEALAATLRPAA